MRFTEHELTAALTGTAKTVLAAQRRDVRRGKVDIDTVWDELDAEPGIPADPCTHLAVPVDRPAR